MTLVHGAGDNVITLAEHNVPPFYQRVALLLTQEVDDLNEIAERITAGIGALAKNSNVDEIEDMVLPIPLNDNVNSYRWVFVLACAIPLAMVIAEYAGADLAAGIFPTLVFGTALFRPITTSVAQCSAVMFGYNFFVVPPALMFNEPGPGEVVLLTLCGLAIFLAHKLRPHIKAANS